MSRVAISLDLHALAELRKRAEANKEPVARTAARLVRDGLLSHLTTRSQATQDAQIAAAAASPQATELPSWIEPAARPQQWRRALWATVTALQLRYPCALGRLPADWYADRALTEMIAALGQWRANLDAGEQRDPRAELLFHDRLSILERHLAQSTDPTTPRFAGGPPLPDWAS
jgi:hypothetical protein